MIVYSSLGEPKTHQKIVPGATATGVGAEFYIYTERTLPFTSGKSGLVVGAWIVGGTSAAKAEIVSIVITSGTLASNNAVGTLRIKCQHGTFQSETINVAGSAAGTIAANSSLAQDSYYSKGLLAKSILVSVITQTALVGWDGMLPDQTSLTGHSMVANSSIVIQDINAIRNFRCIDYANGSATVVNVTCYF